MKEGAAIYRGYLRAACIVGLIFVLAGLCIGIQRSFPLLIFSVANLFLLIPCVSLRERFFPSCHGVDALLVCVTLYLGFLVFGLTVLGLIGLLSLGNCFIASFVFFLVSTFFLPVPTGIPGIAQSLRKAFGILFQERFISSCALIFVVLLLSYRIYTPPASFDDLMYHLAYPVEWLKSSSLTMPPRPFGQPAHAYFPFDSELILFWLLLPLKSDFLAKFGQAGFVLLTVAAIFSISRKIGLSERWALLCSLLAFAMPKLAIQGVFRAGNDIVFTFFFLVSLNFLIILKREFTAPAVVCFAVAIGLCAGTKSLALTYVPPLVIIFIYLAIRRRRASRAAIITPLLLFLIIVMAVGGACYLRNLLVTGNPIYPLKVSVGSTTVLDGPITKEVFHQPHWARLNPREDYPAMCFIIFSCAVAVLMLVTPRPGRREKSTIALISGLSLYILLAFYWLVPIRNTRFLYPGMMLSAISLSWTASEMYARGKNTLPLMRILILVLLAYIMVTFLRAGDFAPAMLSRGILSFCLAILITGLMLALFIAGRRYFLRGMKLKGLGTDLVTAALAVLLVGCILHGRDIYEENKYRSRAWLSFPRHGDGKVWKWVDDHAGTEGVTIGYTGIENIYPFYGRWLRNNVIPVMRGKPAGWRFGLPLDETGSIIYANNFAGRYVGLDAIEKDKINAKIFGWGYHLWLGNLFSNGIDWVLVYGKYKKCRKLPIEKRFKGYPIEDKWAASNPGNFELIYSSQPYRIYKLRNR